MFKNNKGFMLIEVIVTATIVMTSMIFLYTSVNKIYNNFKTKITYYNLDATYATKNMFESMIEKNGGGLNEFINDVISQNTYGYIITDNNPLVGNCTVSKNCTDIKNLYNIKNMILSEYDTNSLKNLLNSEIVLNETFKDYINYIITYYAIEETKNDYSYIILTEIEDGEENYYANLRVR